MHHTDTQIRNDVVVALLRTKKTKKQAFFTQSKVSPHGINLLYKNFITDSCDASANFLRELEWLERLAKVWIILTSTKGSLNAYLRHIDVGIIISAKSCT